jgi:type IV fimbrial biogenesis protein FimT
MEPKKSVGKMEKTFKYALAGGGFSLVELMVTVAIAAILMAIAAPSFSIFIDNQKLLTTATEFYSAVNMTRSEAIKRGAQVTLAANDGVAWTSGWTVFVDTNGNARPDAGETTIFTHDATSKKWRWGSSRTAHLLISLYWQWSKQDECEASNLKQVLFHSNWELQSGG